MKMSTKEIFMTSLTPCEWLACHMEAWRVALCRISEEEALEKIHGVTSNPEAEALFWHELREHKKRLYNAINDNLNQKGQHQCHA